MSKQNSFVKGAAILGMAGVIVKILGAIYRIPLSNIIKAEGMGYYQTAYPFYVLLLTISTSGIPVAVAKIVSEKRALGDYSNAQKVFKTALTVMAISGLLTSSILLIFAKKIVNYLGNPNAYYALIALTPALLFVPIMSAFRGFFQGRQNMVPTALSQIVEQLFRVVFGLTLTVILLDKGIPIAAGGASLGGSVGAIFGTICIVFIYYLFRDTIKRESHKTIEAKEYPAKSIIRDLLLIAIPITIGSAIAPIMDAIDASLVLRRLQSISFTQQESNALYGQLKGMAQTLINLPQVFSMAIAMSLVPAISSLKAKDSKEELNATISSGIRITLLIGLPCALGIFVLAEPIIRLLYFSNTEQVIVSTGKILRYLSLGVVFLTLVQSLTAIIQGLGKPFIPVRNLFIGALAKVLLTYTLTAIPAININGAAISTVTAYAIASLLNLKYVITKGKIHLDLKDIFIKPFISSIIMSIFAASGYYLVHLLAGNSISTLTAVVLGVISYVVALFMTKTITKEDILLMTKNEKILAIADKYL